MNDEILQKFLDESWQNLGRLESEIDSTESARINDELLLGMFETVHSISRKSSQLGFSHLGEVARSTQNVLGRIHDDNLSATSEVISITSEAIDQIKDLLLGIESTGAELPKENSQLIAKLNQLATSDEPAQVSGEPITGDTATATQADESSSSTNDEPHPEFEEAALEADSASQHSTEDPPHAEIEPQLPDSERAPERADPEVNPETRRETTRQWDKADAPSPESADEVNCDHAQTEYAEELPDASVRVHVEVLQNLIRLVRDLMLAEERLDQLTSQVAEQQQAVPVSTANEVMTEHDEECRSRDLLLVDAGAGTTKCIPVDVVSRVDEVARKNIEDDSETKIFEYRGESLPLFQIDGVDARTLLGDRQPIVVCSKDGRSVGLMVEQIRDVVAERLVIQMSPERAGVLGTAIVDGQATDVIDLQFYLRLSDADWINPSDGREDSKVLVVDSSLFFRQLVTTALESASYRVTAVESDSRAVELIEGGTHFDAIVTETNFPTTDGNDFVRLLRSHPETAETPLIGLSGLSNEAFEESRALQAGCNRFLKKFNAQRLPRKRSTIANHEVMPA
jgi:chemotaxis protein histidine kinase CheA